MCGSFRLAEDSTRRTCREGELPKKPRLAGIGGAGRKGPNPWRRAVFRRGGVLPIEPARPTERAPGLDGEEILPGRDGEGICR